MSDELKNGDRVRMVDNHNATGVYIGRSPVVERPEVVRVDSIGSYSSWASGTWERIPDEVTITIPREVARDYAWGAYDGADHDAVADACRKALPDWDDES